MPPTYRPRGPRAPSIDYSPGIARERYRNTIFRSNVREKFRKALEKFRERYFTSTLQSTMMRTSRTNGTINNTSWYEDPRLPRNGEETMDMDMQDFQIKFDESTIDINDDYRMNVKLIPRVAWKKSLDSKYHSMKLCPHDPCLSLYF